MVYVFEKTLARNSNYGNKAAILHENEAGFTKMKYKWFHLLFRVLVLPINKDNNISLCSNYFSR